MEERMSSVANQLGKRLYCKECGIELLCTKAGEGTITCCNVVMELKKPVALPTAD
mgnify:FL=1